MKSLSGIVAAVVLMAAYPSAYADFSGNAAFTTDYTFRGITQSDGNPAIQGGFDYEHPGGWYAGLWGSSVDFNENQADGLGHRASLELDLFGGYRGKLPAHLGWDAGAIHYAYPGAGSARHYDYTEAYGALTYDADLISGKLGLQYSPNYFADSGNGLYYYAEAHAPLPVGLKANAHIGRQTIEKNGAFGTPDYTDWRLGVSTDLMGLGFALDYADTSLSKSDCFGGTDFCDSRLIFSVSKGL